VAPVTGAGETVEPVIVISAPAGTQVTVTHGEKEWTEGKILRITRYIYVKNNRRRTRRRGRRI